LTLEQLYLVSQIIAAGAVVLTLVFVGYELRQNTASLRLSTEAVRIGAYHQAIDQIKHAWMQPDFPDLLLRARAEDRTFTERERLRLDILVSADLFGHEIALHLAEQELIDAALWANMLANNRDYLVANIHMERLAERTGPLSARLREVLAKHGHSDMHAARVDTTRLDEADPAPRSAPSSQERGSQPA